MENETGFFAIITGKILRDKRLPANAKLLYGDITALTNQEGYCWASNAYFAKLYEVSQRTIRAWISKLAELQYLRIEVIRNESMIVEQRKIYVTINNEIKKKTSSPPEENFQTSGEKLPDLRKKTSAPPEENFLYNNTINNTSNNTKNIDKRKKKKMNPNLIKHPKYDFMINKNVHEKLVYEYGQDRVDEEYDNMNDYFEREQIDPYKDCASGCRNWLKKAKAKKIQIKHEEKEIYCPVCETVIQSKDGQFNCPSCSWNSYMSQEQTEAQKRAYAKNGDDGTTAEGSRYNLPW